MPNRSDAGFTMIELMVATSILVVVLASVMQSFLVNHRTYQTIEQTVEAQQTGRTVADLLEREIRMTGFMVPEAVAVCGVDRTNAPDTLYLTDSDAVAVQLPGGAPLLEPTAGALLTSAYASAATTQTLTLADLAVDGSPFYDSDADGTLDGDFRIGAGAILANIDMPQRGSACGIVVDVDPALQRVRVAFENAITFAAGSRYALVPAHVYSVDAQRLLTRDGVFFASDVEDLQVAYFFDLDTDGEVDAGETLGAAGTNYVSQNRDHTFLREIRVNVVTRTRDAEQTFTNSTPIFQTTENRAPVALADGFRRRVQQVSARPRNVGARGTGI